MHVQSTTIKILIAFLSLFLTSFAFDAVARHSSHTKHHHATNSQSGVFDYYLLSLSWSPTYCLTHQSDKTQCGHSKGYGFVLHGLWPQFDKGGYPHDCMTSEQLTSTAIKFAKTIYPSPKLIQHEWQKHGTCNGTDAITYFKAADQVRTSIAVPAQLEHPQTTQTMSATNLISLFMAANPKIPDNGIIVSCSGPEMSEVRVCFDKDSSPRTCGKGVKSSCRRGLFKIPATR